MPVNSKHDYQSCVHNVTRIRNTQPRTVEVPDDLAAALATEPEAQAFYATLNYSSQRRYVGPVADAETAETRSRRVTKVVSDLKAGKK